MNTEDLKVKFRNQLITVHAVAVIFATLVEIIAYVIYVYMGKYPLSFGCPYLWHSLLIPAAINFGAHITARLIGKSEKFANDEKNTSLIYATLVTTSVVSLVHRDFIIAASAFIFPMMLSANFNSRKLLKHSLVASVISLTATTLILWAENKINAANAVNLSALYAFSIISYLSGIININYSNRSTEIITTQAKENSILEETLKKDPMTELFNHRMFYNHLESSIEKYHSENLLFSLAMLDVDDFKSVNDTYGHDNGDKVLKTLATVISEYCAANETAFRYGGEEFAILFVGKTSNQANSTMKKILQDFRQRKYSFTTNKITFSCGVVQYDGKLTKDEFFAVADSAMYTAKKSGKNTVHKYN